MNKLFFIIRNYVNQNFRMIFLWLIFGGTLILLILASLFGVNGPMNQPGSPGLN